MDFAGWGGHGVRHQKPPTLILRELPKNYRILFDTIGGELPYYYKECNVHRDCDASRTIANRNAPVIRVANMSARELRRGSEHALAASG